MQFRRILSLVLIGAIAGIGAESVEANESGTLSNHVDIGVYDVSSVEILDPADTYALGADMLHQFQMQRHRRSSGSSKRRKRRSSSSRTKRKRRSSKSRRGRSSRRRRKPKRGGGFGDAGEASLNLGFMDGEFMIGADYAIYLTPNWGLEADIGYAPDIVDGFDVSALTATVGGRYRFNELAENLKIYGAAGIGIISLQGDADESGFALSVGPGLAYYFSDTWAVKTDIRLFVHGLDNTEDSTFVRFLVGVVWDF